MPAREAGRDPLGLHGYASAGSAAPTNAGGSSQAALSRGCFPFAMPGTSDADAFTAASVLPAPRREAALARPRAGRALAAAVIWLVVLANAGVIVWLWADGGNLDHLSRTGDLLTSLGRLTGLLGAYLALIQVLLLARIPVVERVVGFDRLTVWHRWNGHACIDLILAHVVLTVWGYALLDKLPLSREISTMLGGNVYPGMITATVGTALLVAVAWSSIAIVRRRMRYEWWYAVHLTAYAGIALSWFHEIPTGNELVLNTEAADYWRALYAATLALLVVFRLAAPLADALRHRLRVAEVVPEGPGVVSLRITGHRLERLRAEAGQFFLWRFLARGHWATAHPFSLSAAPDGRSLRITVKALGNHTARLAGLRPGTRVLAEGPFGVFTAARRRRDDVVLIAGGIGITPVRALLEEMPTGTTVLYRALAPEDVVFRDELESLARERRAELHYVVGDHAARDGHLLLSPEHLDELVPDLADRDVYLCGPPAMVEAVESTLRRAGVRRRRIHVERFAL
jgi:predicted ferric reductase